MKKIILLTDYKGNLGSKCGSIPYRSGFNKKLISDIFEKKGYYVEYIPLSYAKKIKNVKNIPVLYTSSEDIGYHYKDYIEDIIYYLEIKGAKVIPPYKYLRANNNKVFMELLREKIFGDIKNLQSWVFGTLEEMENSIDELNFPIVIKTARGAMSKGIYLANNKKELIKKVKKISRSKYFLQDIKDKLRPLKHKGYKTESLYRKKFILQEFIPNLKNDWKVLIFGDNYFIFERPVRKNDFRASGSGQMNYLYGSRCKIPDNMLTFARNVFSLMDVPNVSLDVIKRGGNFYITEFQAVYFGTVGVIKSDIYFEYNRKENIWETKKNNNELEWYYVNSIVKYLEKNEK